MEAVHKPSNRTWIDDKLINVKQFLDEWMEVLNLEKCESHMKSFVSDLSEEEISKLEEECGLSTMRCQYQERVELSNSITIPDGVDLKTLRIQAEDLKKRKDDPKYNSAVYHSLKFRNYPPHKNFSTLTDLSSIPHQPVIIPEVILSVQVFLPERRLDPKTAVAYSRPPSFQLDQEFLVLGCQFLSELRDKIECVSDKTIPGELSDFPTMIPTVTCKDLYKSGFFYINGVFYNDMRDKYCRDYSEVIIKWAEKANRGIGPFKKSVMEETRFIDLDVQLGCPYVYIHQGECEHLMVFTDLRVFSEHDCDNRNAYPLYVQVKPAKRVFCMICSIYTASWIVYDNKRLPENPFFFCKTCYLSFNYDNNNQKIGTFKAYHFPDSSKII